MIAIFQLLNCKNGHRSPALKLSRTELADAIAKENPDDIEHHMVIVLMDESTGDWDFASNPLINAKHFVEEFKSHA